METPPDDGRSNKLSKIEIEQLITTKFVCPDESEDQSDAIEVPRSVGSPLQLSPIERQIDDIVLDDYDCLIRPIKESIQLDSAVVLLDRIQNSSEEVLRDSDLWNVYERSQKWKNTSRVSELTLVDFMITSVNHRPLNLHIFCHHVTPNDLLDIIRKSMNDVVSPKNHQSLFRLTIKSKVSLNQFIINIEKIWVNEWRAKDKLVTSFDPSDEDSRFLTNDILKFIDSDNKLAQAFLNSSARFSFYSPEKPYVTVNFAHNSELDRFGTREDTIVIEQFVRPAPGTTPTRHVSFGIEEVEKIWEFEVDEDEPFYPIPPRGYDLIEYLEKRIY